MAEQEVTLSFITRTKAMLLCYTVFVVLYMTAQYLSIQSEFVYSFVMPIDLYIPFLPWMIIPYATSAIFFVLVFYWVDAKQELVLLTKRMVLLTLIAFVCFVICPISFSDVKPKVNNPFLQFGFDFIATWDSNYNQAPSLHVAYGILFLNVVYKHIHNWLKLIYACAIVLLCVSTLFVYQHHSIDLFTAVWVCLFVFYVTLSKQDVGFQRKKIAIFYYSIATLFLFLAALWLNVFSIFLSWITIVLLGIGTAYYINDVYFIKDKQGNVSLVKRIVYLPYLVVYKLLWIVNQIYKPVVPFELVPDFFCGPYLNTKQAAKVFGNSNIIIVDVSAELIENSFFKNNSSYYFLPSLDLTTPHTNFENTIVNKVKELYLNKSKNTVLYLHCAMGYSRSMYIAKLIYKSLKNVSDVEATSFVKEKNKYAIIKKEL